LKKVLAIVKLFRHSEFVVRQYRLHSNRRKG
jgi:hypothetical protein